MKAFLNKTIRERKCPLLVNVGKGASVCHDPPIRVAPHNIHALIEIGVK